MLTRLRSKFMLTSVFALLPTTTLAGTVLVPSASVTGTSSYSVFYATNHGTGPAIQALSVGGMALNASTRSPYSLAIRALNSSTSGGGAIYAGSAGNTIQAISQHANAFVGVTKASSGAAGVYGLDPGTSQYNAGVEGVSNLGYGVIGHSSPANSCVSSFPAVNGLGGVAGFADNGGGTGVLGMALTGTCGGYATFGTGVSGDGNIGVLGIGEDYPGDDGVVHSSAGVGLYGKGSIGAQIVGYAGIGGYLSRSVALAINEQGANPVILASGTGGGMSLDTNGNLIISGTLTQHGTPQTNPAATASSTSASSQGRPTTENVGESRLTYGQAFVRLTSAWAHDVDFSQPYEVFVTPNASSAGVYVAERSSAGFAVRENSGGHSNVPFSYRIVAKTKQLPATNSNTKGGKGPDNTMADRIIAKMRLGMRHYGHPQVPKLQTQ